MAGSRWDPLPQGDYDDGATAFVKLPEGGIDALLADSPLAAPGHGYVPPPFQAAPGADTGADPSTGSWALPPETAAPGQQDAVRWPDPNALPEEHRQPAQDGFEYHPGGTGQWDFDRSSQGGDPGAPGHDGAGHDVTGQWSIPVADGDLPDESGEFTTSSLVEQWGGGSPPATLPGGAAAPWADEPWVQQPAGVPGEHPDGTAVPVERDAAHDGSFEPHRGHPEQDHREQDRQEYADAAAAEPEAPAAEAAAPETASPETSSAQAPSTDAALADASTAEASATEAASGAEAASSEAAPSEEPAAESGADDSPAAGAAETAPPHDDHPLAAYVLRVNGVERPVTDAWIGESLLYVLRERLGLAGAKDGCSQGECGACNVQVDGRLVASCLVPAVTAAGSEVRTVEGLAADGQPSDVQRALARCGAVQCGFCIPGMAMTVHDLLEGNPAPTDLETRQALCGNLCRCSGYRGVLEAVREVVAGREAHTAAEGSGDGDEARIPHQAGPGGGGVNPSAFEPHQPDQPPHEQPYGQDGGQA
ncbi:(2Fe-2S)-binding protein [Streptomyces sp. MMBL 11-3]|uniref:(2Fe-2S)-binding protein n=1 Tax=Streptomyces sp. MMBL 11-3 TaxID=3382639 RepID=UPI0039B38EF6